MTAILQITSENEWDVVVGSKVIGSVLKFAFFEISGFTGIFNNKPVKVGYFNSKKEAAKAVEDAWRESKKSKKRKKSKKK